MKTQLWALVAFVVIACNAYARLGWTEKQLVEKYGKVEKREQMAKGVESLYFAKLINDTQYIIGATMLDGEAISMIYVAANRGDFPHHLRQQILKVNFRSLKVVKNDDFSLEDQWNAFKDGKLVAIATYNDLKRQMTCCIGDRLLEVQKRIKAEQAKQDPVF